MGTDIRRTTSIDRLSKRALAFDMDHSEVDGMNVLKVYDHVKQIVAKVRKNKKPYLLEALTYRYRGHSVSDPGNYRTKEEVKTYQDKDPLLQMAATLKKEKIADDKDLEDWDTAVRARVQEAEDFADQSPPPDVSEAYLHVLVD
jgi:pyruvate dehydrogenase E1 component alpha subunit